MRLNNAFNSAFKLKSFSQIPSLKTRQFIGHAHLFLPTFLGGKYKIEKLTEAIEGISKQLGTIFTLNLGGIKMLVTLDAEHTKTMYRHEGKFPLRPSFDALIKYRRETFKSVGVVPGNGEEWHHFRTGVNPLLKLEMVKQYETKFENVAREFVKFVERQTNSQGNITLSNIYNDLLLFSIQAISTVSPGYEFDCLSSEQSIDSQEIINASIDFMEGLYATLIGLPVWKLYKNAGYKKLESSHNTIHQILSKHIQKCFENYTKNADLFKSRQPFIYSLFNNERLSYQDCVMLTMETFLGGIDATATTLSFTLWHLAQDEELQETVRRDHSNELLRCCIKETLRLKTTAGANSRFMPHEADIGGYLIPQGTLVMSFVSAIGKLDKYFEKPLKYQPKRWLRSQRGNIHPYASLPFGHGARMCPGRRIAENEMTILLKNVLDNFKVASNTTSNEEIGMIYRMNRIPEKPIEIQFNKLKK